MNDIADNPEIESAERTGYGQGRAPTLVGCCGACNGEMYGYDAVECGDCGRIVHLGCIVKCIQDDCDHEGCKKCMSYSEFFGEWFDGDDCEIARLKEYKTELDKKMMEEDSRYIKTSNAIAGLLDEMHKRRKELESE